jgi:hypothetical protein
MRGLDSKPFGCLQIRVRIWVSARVVTLSDDGLESIEQAMSVKMMPHVFVVRRSGDGSGGKTRAEV